MVKTQHSQNKIQAESTQSKCCPSHPRTLKAKLASMRRILVFVSIALTTLLIQKPSFAESYEIMPLSAVKPGQKGYGLTTFSGTVPERFEFEVVGVNKNFLPKMDIILVKSNDPKIQTNGFWQGMSGSPMFIDGKLVCAFSYGFRFNKKPIGGCTPIHYMKEEGLAKRRRLPNGKKGKNIDVPQAVASFSQWEATLPSGKFATLLTERPNELPFSTPSVIETQTNQNGMQPAAIPLALSGFGSKATIAMQKMFSKSPFEMVQAGGTGNSKTGPTSFRMGGPIAVQFIRGDMSAAGTGTVSWIKGKDVLAFGHPMFHSGEIYAPVTAAHVHTVIPSAQIGFVLASPSRELGALTQDRQSTIAADTDIKVRMIPVEINVFNDYSKKPDTFHVEILNNPNFSANFAAIAAINATSRYAADKEHATVRLESTMKFRDFPEISFTDLVYAPGGPGNALQGSRGLRVLGPLLQNPFAPLQLEKMTLNIKIDYRPVYSKINSIRLRSSRLIPGKKNTIILDLEHHHQQKSSKELSFYVPKDVAGSVVQLIVSSGDQAPLNTPPPKTIKQLFDFLKSAPAGDAFAVTLLTSNQGASVGGTVIQDLPASAIDRLMPSSQNSGVENFQALTRTLYPSKRAVAGNALLLAPVDDL